MVDWKRLFGRRSDNPSEKFLENDSSKASLVAVLSVTPWLAIGSKCEVEDHRDCNDNHKQRLQNDPVSLCVVGGIQDRIHTFCEKNPAHRFSWRGMITLLLCCCVAIPCMIWLPARDLPQLLLWYVGVLLGWTLVCVEHGRAFWQSMDDLPSLVSELATILNRCGYELEVQLSQQQFFVYKMEGVRQSLPAVGASTNDGEEPSAQKMLLLLKKLGAFRYVDTKYDSFGDDDGDALSLTTSQKMLLLLKKLGAYLNVDTAFLNVDTNNDSFDDDDGDVLSLATSDLIEYPPFPLDFWTIRGLLLGKILNIKARLWRLDPKWLLIALLVTGFNKSPYYWLIFMFWLVVDKELRSYRWVDLPEFHTANQVLVSRLSPLIEDRHNGCSLRYEIKRGKGSNIYSIRMLQELFVLEDHPSRDDSVHSGVV